MKTSLLLIASAALLGGCVYPRPGVPQQSSGGLARGTATVLGAGAGAYIGEKQGGTTGALIGGAAGALVTNLATTAIQQYQTNQVEEAAEAGRREERVKVMNDYWQSHAIDGGNGPQGTSDTSTKPKVTPVVYPAGVYDGVLQAPRVDNATTAR